MIYDRNSNLLKHYYHNKRDIFFIIKYISLLINLQIVLDILHY